MQGGARKDHLPAPANDRREQEEQDEGPAKRPVLGELTTEEEDRLQAEIENLRRQG